MNSQNKIVIPGDFLEGGGQIIRTALSLSAITKKSFEAVKIRHGRKNPGLKSQHLYSIKALKDICDAKTDDDELGSERILFVPFKLKGGNYKIDVKTAGSISLVLQAVLPPLMFANRNSKVEITGGTHGLWAPTIEYLQEVLVPQLRRFAHIEISLKNRGYYPKGEGRVIIKVRPKYKISEFADFKEFKEHMIKDADKINLVKQQKLIQIKGISHASIELENSAVAKRQAESAEITLKKNYDCPISIQHYYDKTKSTGSGITLWAIFSEDYDEINVYNPIRLGADCLGKKGKSSEEVGENAANNLIKEIQSYAPVDKFLSDQLLLFMALTKKSKIKVSEITKHTRTNIHIIEQFLGKTFQINEKDNIISTID